MTSFSTQVVEAILAERQGLQRVALDSGRRAYVLTDLLGAVAVGDRVVVNTTAVDLGLGTGGWDVIHWNLAREGFDGPHGGHVMKLRYTSLQCATGAAEEREGYRPPETLGGMPVVVCGVHSQVAAVAAAFAEVAPGRRLGFVMTDAAALPLALSDLVAELRGSGLLATTVTAGQAFGGDAEAVNVRSALDVAALAGADAVVVGPGPGGVGTGSPLGHSGLEGAAAVDAAARGGATAVLAVRASEADSRPRHRGISHHTTAVLAYVHEPVVVAVPRGRPGPPGCRVVEVDVPDVAAVLEAQGIVVTTMGRGVEEDRAYFEYAAAAGVAAAQVLVPAGGSVPAP